MIRDIFEVWGDRDLAAVGIAELDDIRLLLDIAGSERTWPENRELQLICNEFESDTAVLTSCLGFMEETLLLSAGAVEILRLMLRDAGHFAPTTFRSSSDYKLFICNREIDALDREKSEFERLPSGSILSVSRYHFVPELIAGIDIFTLRDRHGSLYVSDRFVSLVQQHRLHGFRFLHIWNNQAGAVSLHPHEPAYEAYPGETEARAEAKRQAMRETLARDQLEQ